MGNHEFGNESSLWYIPNNFLLIIKTIIMYKHDKTILVYCVF